MGMMGKQFAVMQDLKIKSASELADTIGMLFQLKTLAKPAPLSNNERQRRFRKRNPGYYARLQAKRRAGHKNIILYSEEQARPLTEQQNQSGEIHPSGQITSSEQFIAAQAQTSPINT